MIVLLPGRGQHGNAAAVKALFQCDDVVIIRTLARAAPFACGLDRALVCLQTGIGEKHLRHSGALAEHLRKLRHGRGVVKIGCVLEFPELLCDGLLPRLVAQAEDIHGDAAAEIDVFPAVRAQNRRAFAAGNFQREAVVGVRDILPV